MNWIEKKDFPKALNENCYILAKHCSFMSDSIDEFEIFTYIKNENKLYQHGMNDGYVYNFDKTERFNFSFTHYCVITGIDYLLFPPTGKRTIQ